MSLEHPQVTDQVRSLALQRSVNCIQLPRSPKRRTRKSLIDAGGSHHRHHTLSSPTPQRCCVVNMITAMIPGVLTPTAFLRNASLHSSASPGGEPHGVLPHDAISSDGMGHGVDAAVAAASHGSHGEAPALGGGEIVVLLFTLSIALQIINNRKFKWPPSIFVAVGSLFVSIALAVLSQIPGVGIDHVLSEYRDLFVDFPDIVLNYMLGFLLFASAIHVDIRILQVASTTVLALSFGTTMLSACMVSILTYLLLRRIYDLDFRWCMLFGAIVSPTDPVAVISILHNKPGLLTNAREYFVVGESLLNDAVGVLLYMIAIELVENPDMGFFRVTWLFVEGLLFEGLLGVIIGVALAVVAYYAIQAVNNDDMLEIAITFALVGNINMVCGLLGASIPMASVTAGLLIGNYAPIQVFSKRAKPLFKEIWTLMDEVLNAMLFLLIGAAEVLWQPQPLGAKGAGIVIISTICISLFARFVSVLLPLGLILLLETFTDLKLRGKDIQYDFGTMAILTWGGMRGGISIALALGVPDAFATHAVPGHMTAGQMIFFMTFSLVLFSICIQGLLFEKGVQVIEVYTKYVYKRDKEKDSFFLRSLTDNDLVRTISRLDSSVRHNPGDCDASDDADDDNDFSEEYLRANKLAETRITSGVADPHDSGLDSTPLYGTSESGSQSPVQRSESDPLLGVKKAQKKPRSSRRNSSEHYHYDPPVIHPKVALEPLPVALRGIFTDTVNKAKELPKSRTFENLRSAARLVSQHVRGQSGITSGGASTSGGSGVGTPLPKKTNAPR